MITRIVCGMVGGLAILTMANPCFCAPSRDPAAHEGCPGHEAPSKNSPVTPPQECCCAPDALYADSRFSASTSVSMILEDLAIVGERQRPTTSAVGVVSEPFADRVPLWLKIRCLRR